MRIYFANLVTLIFISALMCSFLPSPSEAKSPSKKTQKEIIKYAVNGKPGVNHKSTKVADLSSKELIKLTSDTALITKPRTDKADKKEESKEQISSSPNESSQNKEVAEVEVKEEEQNDKASSSGGNAIGSAAKTLLSAIFKGRGDSELPNVTTAEKDGELTRVITVRKDDNFIGIFKSLGYDAMEVEQMAEQLKKDSGFETSNIKPGQKFILKEKIEGKKKHFISLKIDEKYKTIEVAKEAGKEEIKVEKKKKKLDSNYIYKVGKVKSTLVGLGSELGIPSTVVATAIKILGSRNNLSVDVRKNDVFEVLYEEIRDNNGKLIDYYVEYVSLKGKIINTEAFSYSSVGDRTKANYYDTKGRAFKKSILRNPLKANYRISSGFGYRKHPVLKRRILHSGTDFAAPRGTPIYAGGDGVISKIGRFGGYGNYIKIQHDSKWETAYGHMQRFAKGMRKWKRVKQGELIGYVGSTGRSTGPHLHYEIIRYSKPVDTRKVELPVGIQLNRDSVKKLNGKIVKIRSIIDDLK